MRDNKKFIRGAFAFLAIAFLAVIISACGEVPVTLANGTETAVPYEIWLAMNEPTQYQETLVSYFGTPTPTATSTPTATLTLIPTVTPSPTATLLPDSISCINCSDRVWGKYDSKTNNIISWLPRNVVPQPEFLEAGTYYVCWQNGVECGVIRTLPGWAPYAIVIALAILFLGGITIFLIKVSTEPAKIISTSLAKAIADQGGSVKQLPELPVQNSNQVAPGNRKDVLPADQIVAMLKICDTRGAECFSRYLVKQKILEFSSLEDAAGTLLKFSPGLASRFRNHILNDGGKNEKN